MGKLIDAIKNQNIEGVRFLLADEYHSAKKIDKEVDTFGSNALHIAAENGFVEIINSLLNLGADPNKTTKEGKTALHVAAEAGFIEVVRILKRKTKFIQDKAGNTPFHSAVEQLHHVSGDISKCIEIIKDLGEYYGSLGVNMADKYGDTPLKKAIKRGFNKRPSLETINALLEAGASVMQEDAEGRSSLHFAAKCGEAEIIEIFYLKCPDLIKVTYRQPKDEEGIFWPVLHEWDSCVKRIREKTVDGSHNLSLGMEVDEAIETAARKLLKKDTEDGVNETQTMVDERYLNTLKKLVEIGADINEPTSIDMSTPLYRIILIGSLMHNAKLMIKALCQNGANPNKLTKHGDAPLPRAAKAGKEDIINLLLEYGAEIDLVRNDTGSTSLFLAAEHGHFEAVQALLAAGADVLIKNKNGKTPRDIALKKRWRRLERHPPPVNYYQGYQKSKSQRLRSLFKTLNYWRKKRAL